MPTIRLDAEQYVKSIHEFCRRILEICAFEEDGSPLAERFADACENSGHPLAVLNPDVTRTEDADGTLITLRPNPLLVALLEAVEE